MRRAAAYQAYYYSPMIPFNPHIKPSRPDRRRSNGPRRYMQAALVSAFTHPMSTVLPPTVLMQFMKQLPLHG